MTAMQDEKRSEDMGSPAPSRAEPRLPDVERAEVTYYAYDPQTYQILCRPGQQLSPKKAQRLQELKLYAHVVNSAK